jgi:hypothetical protein
MREEEKARLRRASLSHEALAQMPIWDFYRGNFSFLVATFSDLHKEWCNFFFLRKALEKRPVFRATIEPVQ